MVHYTSKDTLVRSAASNFLWCCSRRALLTACEDRGLSSKLLGGRLTAGVPWGQGSTFTVSGVRGGGASSVVRQKCAQPPQGDKIVTSITQGDLQTT